MALQNPLIPAPANQSNEITVPVPPPPASPPPTWRRLRHSLDSSVSDNTRKMYASAWRSFEAWAQGRGALAMPVSPPARRRLPRPPGRGTTSLGGQRPATQGSPGRGPQGRWPPRPHRQRGRPADYEGHRAGPRKGPEAGEATDRRGPGRGESDSPKSRRPLENGKRQESAERACMAGPGGRGIAGHPAGRVC